MHRGQADWISKQVKIPIELESEIKEFIASHQDGEGSFSSVARAALRFYLSARKTDSQTEMFEVLAGGGTHAD